jgi:hypothetical protein
VFTFSQFAIVINFLANQEFIAQNLCENIEKPELECHGKCYLTKKLKEDEKQKGNDKIVQSEVILYVDSKSVEIVSEQFFITEKEKLYFNLLEKKVNGFSSDIFHPPILNV